VDVDVMRRITTAIVLVAMAGVVAIVVFGAPVRALLTLGAVLVCPLSMLLMHRGHTGHGAQEGASGHPDHHTATPDR
jgi:hypothetical protein